MIQHKSVWALPALLNQDQPMEVEVGIKQKIDRSDSSRLCLGWKTKKLRRAKMEVLFLLITHMELLAAEASEE